MNNTDTALMMALQLGQIQAGFLGQTAHELRSPMSHMMSLQQLILADLCEDPAEEKEFIAQCYAASQKFMVLLDLVLDISKLDYGAIAPKSDLFDLVTVIEELKTMLMVKAQNRNLKLNCPDVAEDFSIEMIGDRQRTYQYFLTLLNTTINETPSGDINFEYGKLGDRFTFQLQCQSDGDFWENARVTDLEIKEKPTLKELQHAAEAFEFSPALKWQLLTKLIIKLGGEAKREFTPTGSIQIQGWLPLSDKK